jgi:small subunit ribosomal protein S7
MEQKKIQKTKIENLYNKFLGFLTKKGKKLCAERLLERALILVLKKVKRKKSIVFLRLFLKLNTFVEVKKVKIRNRSYIVPFSLSLKRRYYLVIKWLLLSIKENKEKISTSKKLASEVLTTLTKPKSKTLILKRTNNKKAFFNRSNFHFRW